MDKRHLVLQNIPETVQLRNPRAEVILIHKGTRNAEELGYYFHPLAGYLK